MESLLRLPGAHYACKRAIPLDVPSILKFSKCFHTHYLIRNNLLPSRENATYDSGAAVTGSASFSTQFSTNQKLVFSLLQAAAFRLNHCLSFTHFTLCFLLLLKMLLGSPESGFPWPVQSDEQHVFSRCWGLGATLLTYRVRLDPWGLGRQPLSWKPPIRLPYVCPLFLRYPLL